MRASKLMMIVLLIALTSGAVFLSYSFYMNHKSTQDLLGHLKHERDALYSKIQSNHASDDTSEQSAHEKYLHQRQLWSKLQQKLKNCVAQVFSQVAEFNWVEPYKSPQQGEVCGTAFFISDDGKMITNAHVIDQAKLITIQIPSLGKRRFDAHVIGISPERDIALIQLTDKDLKSMKQALGVEKLTYLKLGDSDSVLRADKIMAIGYPLGQEGLKSTTGVVSGREHLGGQYYIQISAPINKGNSGGPSINSKGEVIGVNSAGIMGAQNVGYIIPSNEVKLFLKQLETFPEDKAYNGIKLLRKPFLGVLFHSSNDSLTSFLKNPAPGGPYVVDIYKESPFARAGVQQGDMVYEINGHELDSYGEMYVEWSPEEKISIVDYASRLMIGDNIHIVYYRNGERKEASFTFDNTKLAPIHQKYPAYETMDYEMIGGLVVMPLTLNHVLMLSKAVPDLTQYAHLQKRMEPALLVTHVFINSQVSKIRSIRPGSIISEVNGMKARTLDDFRHALYKSLDTGFLTIKTKDHIFGVMPFVNVIEDEPKLARMFYYTPTDVVKDLTRTLKDKQKKIQDKTLKQ
jgi:serine protease Do